METSRGNSPLEFLTQKGRNIKMAYTEAQVNELKAIEGLNYEKAKVFAAKHGISPRSVVAKARALEIPYTTKVPGAKTNAKKEAVRRKADVATSIAELLDTNLASLEKMTGTDLAALEERVKELVGA
jgi:hypothetical protein